MQSDTATLKDHLADSYHMIEQLCLRKEVKNLYPHKILHIDIYSNFIHIAKTWKESIPFSR